MTLREELDARLAEFDLRSANARTRTDAVLARWKQRSEKAATAGPCARLRSFLLRADCDFL